jgi:hypothetical protein
MKKSELAIDALNNLDVNSPDAVRDALRRIRECLHGEDEILRRLVITKAKAKLKGVIDSKGVELALLECPPDQQSGKPWPDDKPSDDPINLAVLLDEMKSTFERHIVLPEGASVAMALWEAHT